VRAFIRGQGTALKRKVPTRTILMQYAGGSTTVGKTQRREHARKQRRGARGGRVVNGGETKRRGQGAKKGRGPRQVTAVKNEGAGLSRRLVYVKAVQGCKKKRGERNKRATKGKKLRKKRGKVQVLGVLKKDGTCTRVAKRGRDWMPKHDQRQPKVY